MNDSRVPAGVPTGGQFTASSRDEVTVDLSEDSPEARDVLIQNALGPGPDLSVDERRVLDALVDPNANEFAGKDADLTDVLDDLERQGNDSSWDAVRAIADRLHARYAIDAMRRPSGAGAFSFALEGGTGYDAVGSFQVGYYLGSAEDAWLTSSDDPKYLEASRRMPLEASGLRKALHVATTLDEAYQRMKSSAERLGLSEKPAPAKPPWPDGDEERAAYLDWQDEASNGDTTASFRDWYENRESGT